MSRHALYTVPKAVRPMVGGPHAMPDKLLDFQKELEQLLRKQLQAQPDVADVRLRLLELLFEQQRADDFVKEARNWHRQIKQPNASREWQRAASMGRMLLPGEALFSGHDSDIVEFVGSVVPLKPKEPPKIQRFGDDDKYRPLFDALGKTYDAIRKDPKFLAELELLILGLPTRRPTPLTPARRLSEHVKGAQILIKREDLAGEHPHLTAAVTGQALMALRLGRSTLVTGSANGRRGAAAAAVAARLGLKTLVFMDAEQAQRQAANVLFMKLMGAEVQIVKAAHYRNRDVREAALAHWAEHANDTFLVTGLDAAPAPYPIMTQEFIASIGRELRRQASGSGKRLPDVIVVRGSQSADALALFPAFLAEKGTRLVCVEAETTGAADPRKEDDPFTQVAIPMTAGEKQAARKILDRLEYPSVAREHARLRASGRVEYLQTSRAAARQALQDFARLEGVVPGIETAHALAWATAAAAQMKPDQSIVVMMAENAERESWDIAELVEGR